MRATMIPAKARKELQLLFGVPLGAAAVMALLCLLRVSSGIAFASAVGLFLVAAGSSVRVARRVLRRNADTEIELNRLRELHAASEAVTKTKRSRGRRDAFNEILLGLEARAEEVQRDRDNLEQLVVERTLLLQRRNEAMRLVLDNVEQGLATIELDGKLSPERSRVFDEWFQAKAGAAASFAEQLCPHDAKRRGALLLAWEQLSSGIFPIELSLDQMPNRLEVGGRHYALGYRPIFEQETLQGVLLVVNDITTELERVRRDVEQREVIAVFERVMRDRAGALQFIAEGDMLVKRAIDPALSDAPQLMRLIHTIKGNCAMFDITSVTEVAHRIEDAVVERQAPPTATELADLANAWRTLSDRLHHLLGNAQESGMEISRAEFENLREASERGASHAELHAIIEQLGYERVAPRLRRTGEQARDLARRLGKGELTIEISAPGDLRLPERWAPFWGSLVHVVRNAVDHGIEPSQERLAQGKAKAGTLRIQAFSDAHCHYIELSDDGRGIDWQRVRERAQERGLPHDSHAHLVDALFADGVSTAEKVSDVSGRGVGMGAVKEAAFALGGTVEVHSTPGQGTAIKFVFPRNEAPASSRDLRQSA